MRSLALAAILVVVATTVVPSPAARAEPVSGEAIYFSSTTGGRIDDMRFRDEDIFAWHVDTGTWSLVFDGTAAGLASSADVNAFAFVKPNRPTSSDLLLSFLRPTDVPGLGLVDDSDVVRFDQSDGSFALELDGSDVGLTTNGEDIDALALRGNDLVISTQGSAHVAGVSGPMSVRDEDAMVLDGATFELVLDGSDLGLDASDIRALHIDDQTGSERIELVLNEITTAQVTADRDDVITFDGTTGASTTGSLSVAFDGDVHGLAPEAIDAMAIAKAPEADPFRTCVTPSGGDRDTVDFTALRRTFDPDDFNVDANPTNLRTVFDAGPDRMRFGAEGLQLAVDVGGTAPLNYEDRAELREKPIGNVIPSGTTQAYCMRFRVRELPRLFGPVTIFQRFNPDPAIDGPDIEVELAGMNQFSEPLRNEVQVVTWDGRHRTGRRLKDTNTLLVVVHTHETNGSFKVMLNGRVLREGSGLNTMGPADGSWFQFGIYPHGLHEGQNRADQIASGQTGIHFEYADAAFTHYDNGSPDLSDFDQQSG